LQFFAGVFVIALMLFALGVVAEMQNATANDPIGLGTGANGALRFLGIVFGSLGALVVLYFAASRSLRHRALVDELLLKVPAVGPCLMAFALSRFCLALRVTHETGMSIMSALRLSMRATGNAAFEARSDVVVTALREGNELTVALANSRLFPEDFQSVVAVAEESGRLSEVMIHQAEYYEEEAGRRLTILTRVAGWAVYVIYAALAIMAIVSIYGTYIQQLNSAM
jgi:type IV pilus assembly protein PilC